MGFFDFNIPYLESNKPSSNTSIEKATRLKLIVKAMELGYTGVAYNRTIKGVMSESDRCSISLFPLSSLLRLSPCLASNVEFHRSVLGVPKTTPFRQYTRLTVVVDSSVQVAALNSGNPVLKTYDIVAVKPVNQMAFEQACRTCEVDLIAIDFSDKLPFRLKQPLVKAAIERGVYFEITYSSLIMDAQARRQMISSAKLLVDWTQGKNLLFSSAAPSITELRGPYDVANLMTLLGITMERAKAAISKNCRSLIADSIRKKKFYKEAIKVELVTKDPEFDEWLKWDPISSGEGDLLLDEMAKSFNASSKESSKVKAIDFASVINSLPANGLQLKDVVPITKPTLEPLNTGNNLSSLNKTSEPVALPKAPKNSDMLNLFSKANQTSAKDQSSDSANLIRLPDEGLKDFTKVSSGLDMVISNHGHELDSGHLQTRTSISKSNVMLQVDTFKRHDMQPERDIPTCQTKSPGEVATVNSLSKEEEDAEVCNLFADTQTSTMLVDHNLSAFQYEECKQSSGVDIVSCTQDVVMDGISNEENIKDSACDTVETLTVLKDYSSACASEVCLSLNNMDAALATPDVQDKISLDTDLKYKSDLFFASDLSSHDCTMRSEQVKGTGYGGVASLLDKSSVLESDDSSVADAGAITDTPMEEQKQIKNQYGTEHHVLDSSKLGTHRIKGKTSRSARMFPFRRFWNSVQFKKKGRTSKRKIVTR